MNYDLLISNFKKHDAQLEIFHNAALQELPTKKALTKVYKNIIKDFKEQLNNTFKSSIKDMDFKTVLNVRMELEIIDPMIYITLDTKENILNANSYFNQRKNLISKINDFIQKNYEHLKDYDYTIINVA